MKTITKIIFASALTVSAAAPAFAYEGDGTLERNTQISTTGARPQHVVGNHVRAHRAMHATDARAYEPADAPVGVDFGIGSQR